MSNFVIVTDSCCDFTDAQYTAYDVAHVSMTVLYKGTEHKNFNDPVTLKDFYAGLRQGENGCSAFFP